MGFFGFFLFRNQRCLEYWDDCVSLFYVGLDAALLGLFVVASLSWLLFWTFWLDGGECFLSRFLVFLRD